MQPFCKLDVLVHYILLEPNYPQRHVNAIFALHVFLVAATIKLQKFVAIEPDCSP